MEEELPHSTNMDVFHGSQQMSNGLSTNFFAYHLRILGGSVALVGLLTAFAHLIPNILQPIWGKASDRSQRRIIWLWAGSATVAIGLAIMALTSSDIVMFAGVMVHAIGISMVTPVWNGLVTDSYLQHQRARAFARLGQIGLVSSLVGSLFAGVLVFVDKDSHGFAIGFAIAACFNVLGLIVLHRIAHPPRTKAIPIANPGTTLALPPSVDLHIDHPTIHESDWKGYLHTQWAYILVMSTIWPLVPLTMLDILQLSTVHIVVFVVVGQLATLLWQPHIPALLEQEHSISLIRKARLVIAFIPLAYALVTFYPAWWGFWFMLLVQILCGKAVAIMNIASPTVVSSASPSMDRARRFGVHNAGIGIAALIGSTTAGFLLEWLIDVDYSMATLLVIVYCFSTLSRWIVAYVGFNVRHLNLQVEQPTPVS